LAENGASQVVRKPQNPQDNLTGRTSGSIGTSAMKKTRTSEGRFCLHAASSKLTKKASLGNKDVESLF